MKGWCEGYLEIEILETHKKETVFEIWYYNSDDEVIRKEGPFRLSKGMTATMLDGIMFKADLVPIKNRIGGD